MKRLLCLSVALLVAAFSTSGCHFWKHDKKPKESSAIATDTEEGFKQRWMDHRVAELVAKGTPAEAAHQQADAEFRQHYAYTHAANK